MLDVCATSLRAPLENRVLSAAEGANCLDINFWVLVLWNDPTDNPLKVISNPYRAAAKAPPCVERKKGKNKKVFDSSAMWTKPSDTSDTEPLLHWKRHPYLQRRPEGSLFNPIPHCHDSSRPSC